MSNPELTKEIIEGAKSYYDETTNEHARYRSWEHCYGCFSKARNEKNNTDTDYLALQLAFYLASWGMYRGSSFLLKRDYKIFIPIVKLLLDKKYDSLLGIKCQNFDETNLDKLEELINLIKKELKSVRDSIKDKEYNTEISDTLVSKILLGTLGCIPAYDENLVKAVRKHEITTGILNRNSIQNLIAFYKDNSNDFENAIKTGNYSFKYENRIIAYPQMKLLDMGLWKIGKEIRN